MAIPSVEIGAREGPQNETRKLPGESHHSKRHRRACQPIDKPARGRHRDPAADQRDELSAEEQPVVGIGQRAKHEGDAGGHQGTRLADSSAEVSCAVRNRVSSRTAWLSPAASGDMVRADADRPVVVAGKECGSSVRHRVKQDVDADRVAFDRKIVKVCRIVRFALVRVAEIAVVRDEDDDATLRIDHRARVGGRAVGSSLGRRAAVRPSRSTESAESAWRRKACGRSSDSSARR